VVRIKIVPGKPGDDTHVLGYTMRQTPVGWKAIDVMADSSISQVVVQQEEIRSVVRSSGADGPRRHRLGTTDFRPSEPSELIGAKSEMGNSRPWLAACPMTPSRR
jgi:hypothetical protein